VNALAGGADVHDVEALRLGQSEGARIQDVGDQRVVFADHAGAAAGGVGHLDELDAELFACEGGGHEVLSPRSLGDASRE
jgi:hypothetical protein